MKFARTFCFFAAVLVMSTCVIAQEGHPLTGTWYGDFGSTPGKRSDLTVVMKWDGSNVSGIVNPGPNVAPIKTARLDVKLGNPGRQAVPARGGNPAQPGIEPTPSTFLVHFEVDAKNKSGGMDHFVFDGKIENPVAGNRSIVGTWTCASTRGDFKLRRL